MYLTSYLILGTAIAKIQKNRMLGYGTGTGTGTVREGKGREGIRDTLIPTYLIPYRCLVGIVDMYIKPQSGRRYTGTLVCLYLSYPRTENRETRSSTLLSYS